jgi:phosphatidylserine/phosphatidylglycerophosphate/cardiolipin synthase-like enzyme
MPVIHARPGPDGAERDTLLQAGRNCAEVTRAARAAVLVDAAEYFRRLEQALARAERSILIVGWDFDGRIRLGGNHDCRPLGEFLRSLADRRPDLQIRILVWSGAVVHGPGETLPLLLGADWQAHPRIALRLDRHHPLYAAHHQKIVVVDDRLAFVGGIDLTVQRWDTCAHRHENPDRLRPDGTPYAPMHDVQMAVDAQAAALVAEVARERWRVATGEDLAPVASGADLWPPDLEADFTDARIGLARTAPAWKETTGIREVAALTEDMLAAARHNIYIEAQYLTASNVRRFMARSLGARRGPEIVVVVRRTASGLVERFVMGSNGERMMRDLRRADRHGRLRLYYPVVQAEADACEVLVHSKVMVVDDRLLRIGSANLNNRSMGLDTECDLAIEARNAEQSAAIAAVRNRLLAEHLGVRPDELARAVAAHGSLIRGIDACNRHPRGLRPFPENDPDGPTRPIAVTRLLDPAAPFDLP